MAGLADLVRNGVALADSLTATLQDAVTYEQWEGADGLGGQTYSAPQSVPCLIERGSQLVVDAQGNEIRAEHTLSLLRPIAPNGAAGRDEPIDPRDRFTLPDGSTGRIAAVESFIDPDTGAGYFHVVSLGEAR